MNTTSFLSQTLDANLIEVHKDIASSKRLLEEMARLLTSALDEDTKEKDIYHLLLEREKLGNTGVGNGVALPHSRCENTNKAVVAIISLNEGIDYDSLDKQPVDIAFGLLVPKEATQDHLNLLADIAKLMSNDRHKKAISSAKSSTEVVRLIQKLSQ